VELFRVWWNEYAAWYALMYDPASGKGELKGYYVSAYAIAVKHGYKGTEEEWLSELDLRVKDAEKHAAESAASAASAMIAVTKYPMIGEDGYWYVWDTVLGEYVKTSVKGEGSPGPAGNGIASITHTGVRDAVNPNFPNVSDGTLVSDVYTITYTDGGTFELVIPRGSRIFTGGYDGVGESIGKDDGIILNVTALQGDYYISKVTGHMWRKASDADQAWEYITTLGGGNFDMAADASKYLAITALQNYDAFIVHDLPGKTMGKITWDRLRSIISSTLEGSVFAAGIIDNNSGCSATLPELEDDTTLLTEADIPRIVAAVIAELNK